jgi:hypothetical protein
MAGGDPNRPLGIGFKAKGPSSRVFYTAVVSDFYSNPSDLANYHKATLRGNGEVPGVQNPQYIDKMPRNSISAYIISDKKGKFKKPYIFYPFFSPHLCLPVKPGEHVWVIFETLRGNESLGYWITRKSVDINVDDINYTHADRMSVDHLSDVVETRSTIDDIPLGSMFGTSTGGGSTSEDFIGPSFPAGSRGQAINRTMADRDQYGEIIRFSEALGNVGYCNQFIGEPVPRFSKAVGDVVLQGSNNAMIVLGSERAGPINTGVADTDTPNPFPGGIPESGQGAIDIVVGRGQTEETAAFSAPDGVLNTRGYHEIPKNAIESESGEENAHEGNPDFINDLSRIYMSMKTSADQNFSINIENVEHSEGSKPAIVLKTAQLRMVASEDLKIVIGEEGTGSAVVLKADGNIVFVPGSGGIIKLGGEDADKAILTTSSTATPAVSNNAGTITATPVITSAGGQLALPQSSADVATSAGIHTSAYATKVLVK